VERSERSSAGLHLDHPVESMSWRHFTAAVAGVLVFCCSSPRLFAADADQDWKALTALDVGPSTKARNSEESRAIAASHLDRQEKALRGFIRDHSADGRAFEAQLRLARLLQIRAAVQGSAKALAESRTLLDRLEKTATPEQQAELDFARITLLMRSMKKPTATDREQLLSATRRFQSRHPGDRRLAALLSEVSRLFLLQPRTMENLLRDAAAFATDEELKGQIRDDLVKLERLGKPLELRFKSAQGPEFDLAEMHGFVVAIVFFAAWAPPSTAALDTVQRAVASVSGGGVKAVGVSLDTKIPPLSTLLQQKGISWPIACDGQGWESPLIRTLGINSLPSVWLVDGKGRLRSLDGLQGTESQLRQLLNER
jgi:hypothetical protein